MRILILCLLASCWVGPERVVTLTITVREPVPCAWLWIPADPDNMHCDDADEDCQLTQLFNEREWAWVTATYYRDFVMPQCGPPEDK